MKNMLCPYTNVCGQAYKYKERFCEVDPPTCVYFDINIEFDRREMASIKRRNELVELLLNQDASNQFNPIRKRRRSK